MVASCTSRFDEFRRIAEYIEINTTDTAAAG